MAATSQAARLIAQLPETMAADAAELARRIERARRGPGVRAEWDRIAAAVARSIERRRARAARRPAITYPPELPVAQRRRSGGPQGTAGVKVLVRACRAQMKVGRMRPWTRNNLADGTTR